MSFSETNCYLLAMEIEEVHAKEMARAARIRRRWESFYDPHAATELGALIYRRLRATLPNSGLVE